jgi:hypothetical protein
VDIPDPHAGLVIRYAYLWRDEHRRGLVEGSKDRPCAVVLAVERVDGRKRVVVAAITHSAPQADSRAIPLPPQTARRFGLDDLPHWIVTSEFNVFTWPGPDIRPIPGSNPSSVAYGQLPYTLTNQLIDAAREYIRSGSTATIERDET